MGKHQARHLLFGAGARLREGGRRRHDGDAAEIHHRLARLHQNLAIDGDARHVVAFSTASTAWRRCASGSLRSPSKERSRPVSVSSTVTLKTSLLVATTAARRRMTGRRATSEGSATGHSSISTSVWLPMLLKPSTMPFSVRRQLSTSRRRSPGAAVNSGATLTGVARPDRESLTSVCLKAS